MSINQSKTKAEILLATEIAHCLDKFFKWSFQIGLDWLRTKNPYFKNRIPGILAREGNHMAVLDYVKKNMDPKVRARCLKYKSEVKT